MSLFEALFSDTNSSTYEGGGVNVFANRSTSQQEEYLATMATTTTAGASGEAGPFNTGTTSASSGSAVHQLPGFTDLVAVLFECFSIITLGYLSCRFKLISPEAKDLGAYLSTFALPMIIFLNIAQMEFQTINLSFLFCMLLAKILLFIAVTTLTLLISYPRNFSYAGALSILATQSNDFALGYPLVKSLYGESKPEMLSYLSLMAPIQLLILNPLGIVMLEFEKSKARAKRQQQETAALIDDVTGQNSGDNDPSRQKRRGCRRCLVYGDTSHTTTQNDMPEQHQQRQQQQQQMPRKFDINRRAAHQSQPRRRLNSGARDKQELASELMRDSQLIPHSLDLGHYGRLNSGLVHSEGQVIGCLHPSVINKRDLGELISSAWKTDNSRTKYGVINCHKCHIEYGLKTEPTSSSNGPSLKLIIPTSLGCSISGSEESIDSLECKLVGCSSEHRHGSRLTSGACRGKNARSPTLPHLLDGLLRNLSSRSGSSVRGASCDGGGGGGSGKDDDDCCRCRQFANTRRQNSEPVVDWSLLRALATNPLIIASIAALAVNLTHGPELPKFVTKVSNTIAASFAAPALLIIGLSMYGKFELLCRNPNDLLLATILVVSKVIILPSMMRAIMLIVLPHYTASEEIPYLADFSYLYGLLPAAPGACIIAKQYDVLGNVVSISMLLSTFLSAPLMLGASYIINQTSDTFDLSSIMSAITQTVRLSSVTTLILSLITICLLLKSDRQSIRCYTRRFSLTTMTARATTSAPTACGSSESVRQDDRNGSAAGPRAMMIQDKAPRMMPLFTSLLTTMQLFIGIGGSLWLLMDLSLDNSDALDRAKFSVHVWPLSAQSDYNKGVAQILGVAQYIFASGGIILSRFVMLSMLITTFALRSRGCQVADRVAALMLRVFLLLGAGLVLCLGFESAYSRCSPIEASLPTWPVSLQLRLIYNLIVLLLALPVLTATFRYENRMAYAEQQLVTQTGNVGRRRRASKQASTGGNSDIDSISTGRQSIISNPSLNSANTANTNLEHSISTNGGTLHDTTAAQVLDCHTLDQLFTDSSSTSPPLPGATNPVYLDDFLADMPQAGRHTSIMIDASDNNHGENLRETNGLDNFDGQMKVLDDAHLSATSQVAGHHHPGLSIRNGSSSGFNRYSILMVFMTIQVVVNLTSTVQVLLQDKPIGTLMQVELTTAALDFGQGLLTFLVVGAPKLPGNLIS